MAFPRPRPRPQSHPAPQPTPSPSAAPYPIALGRTLIIVNPAAQNGAAARAGERLQRFLDLYLGPARGSYELVRTERAGHATELAARGADYDTVVAVGGDGVIHETANGLMEIDRAHRPTLGIVPVGSGNDYARTLGYTDLSGNDFSPLMRSVPVPMDVGRVRYRDGCAESVPGAAVAGEPWRTAYFLETFSFGLDAAIAIGTTVLRRTTGLTGTPLYMLSGLECFAKGYRTYPVRLALDGAEASARQMILCAIQLGPTYGSGFKICPAANPTDGLFDLCWAEGPVPRAVAVPVFLSARAGLHTRSHLMRFARAQRVEIAFGGGMGGSGVGTANAPVPLQVDGEQLEASRLTIDVMPGALRVRSLVTF